MADSTAANTGQSIKFPASMKTIRYSRPKDFTLVTVPEPGPKNILINVKSCDICGSDLHIDSGDLGTNMPLITGHETSGIVVKLGNAVKGFNIGDKVTADNAEVCGYCHYCRQGKPLCCENFAVHGLHREYLDLSEGSLIITKL
ncbi:hypothetical protein PENSTE_c002G07713 [Penicillium steckii]|uniref:Alcohol dehydrogenase-like N-terminal domain-containing protein n=1 Tax=Penicillium steckii TaxID=303698 RepID=A0A1V6TUB5_9EURO|nr:hypothetical protein PENSTE_c002G07713 [Penicillium steckii]